MCGSGTAADGQQLATSSAGNELPTAIGFGRRQVPVASYEYFIEPAIGYLCLAPTHSAVMLQMCVETDPHWHVDPSGMGPWVQAARWREGKNG